MSSDLRDKAHAYWLTRGWSSPTCHCKPCVHHRLRVRAAEAAYPDSGGYVATATGDREMAL